MEDLTFDSPTKLRRDAQNAFAKLRRAYTTLSRP